MSHSGETRREGPATRHVRFKDVLLVEEDETWALALKDALSAGGYRVNLALGLPEAVAALRRKSPELLLVSALLGEQASESLLRELEGRRVPPPVLLVGTRRGESRWEAWNSLSTLSRVEQPFTLGDVLESARAVLGSPWEDVIRQGDPEASA